MRLMVLTSLLGCNAIRSCLYEHAPIQYEATDPGTARAGTGPVAVFDGPDTDRPRLNVRLRTVAEGFEEPTDIQFPPGDTTHMLVLEKSGRGTVLRRGPEGTFGDPDPVIGLTVPTRSEQGLLGAAFHPKFQENGRLYLNYTSEDGATRIAEWIVADPAAADWQATESRTILEIDQPYANHNAGQLAFGPDGMLYLGLGDGGARADPHGHGQDTRTLLGAMLRVDIDRADPGLGYAVPADNPFVGDAAYRPEIWAYGLRNPWRYSFDPQGRLIVADVGQNAWEEVSVVPAGGNMGWGAREGRHCFTRRCAEPSEGGLRDPVYEYDHDEGQSITGGYVSTSPEAGALAGRYVFGDFVSGRIWAIDLPETVSPSPPVAPVYALGRWGILISTFGRDGQGALYVADYGQGRIYHIEG